MWTDHLACVERASVLKKSVFKHSSENAKKIKQHCVIRKKMHIFITFKELSSKALCYVEVIMFCMLIFLLL